MPSTAAHIGHDAAVPLQQIKLSLNYPFNMTLHMTCHIFEAGMEWPADMLHVDVPPQNVNT